MLKTPLRWTPITMSQSSSVILKSRLSRVTPALLTRMWIPPSSSTTRRTASCEPAGGGLRGGLVEVEDGDGRALAGEALGDAEADASCSSGDDGDAAVESTHLDDSS